MQKQIGTDVFTCASHVGAQVPVMQDLLSTVFLYT